MSPPPPSSPTGSRGAPRGSALAIDIILTGPAARALSTRPIRRRTADGGGDDDDDDDDDVVSGQKCGRQLRRGGLRRCEGGRGEGVVHFSRTLLPLYTRSIARTQEHTDARAYVFACACVRRARARLPSTAALPPGPRTRPPTTHTHTRYYYYYNIIYYYIRRRRPRFFRRFFVPARPTVRTTTTAIATRRRGLRPGAEPPGFPSASYPYYTRARALSDDSRFSL